MSEEDGKVPKQQSLLPVDDGFAGFLDEYDGGTDTAIPRMIVGARIKFTNDAHWVTAEGDELDPGLKLVAVKVARVVQKWIEEQPVETIVVPSGQPFPDVEGMNKACPQSEWREDFNGVLRGPWQAQKIGYFTDPKSLDQYTYPTSTIGGSRAISELADKVSWMQRYRGSGVIPIIELSSVHMPTRFGGRMRPHFKIVDWITPGGGGGGGNGGESLPPPKPQDAPTAITAASTTPTPAEPSPKPPANAEVTPPAKPKRKGGEKQKGFKTVSEPTLKEEMSDEIPF
jgi:hypothetical protein